MIQKSIKKWSQHGKASWHWFFIDFGGFGKPSWNRKSDQIWSDQILSGQIRPEHVRSGWVRWGEVRSGQNQCDIRKSFWELEGWGVYPPWRDGSSPGVRNRWAPTTWDSSLLLFGHFVVFLFVHRFFDAVFERFCFVFASQLGSENSPKSMKNRCRDAIPCWLHFSIDF